MSDETGALILLLCMVGAAAFGWALANFVWWYMNMDVSPDKRRDKGKRKS